MDRILVMDRNVFLTVFWTNFEASNPYDFDCSFLSMFVRMAYMIYAIALAKRHATPNVD